MIQRSEPEMLDLELLPVKPLQSLPNKLIQQRKKKSREITTVGQYQDRFQTQQPPRWQPEMLNLKTLPNKLIQQKRRCRIIGTFYIRKRKKKTREITTRKELIARFQREKSKTQEKTTHPTTICQMLLYIFLTIAVIPNLSIFAQVIKKK